MKSARTTIADGMRTLLRADRDRVLHDIDDERQRQALARTAAFVDEHMFAATPIRANTALAAKFELLDYALDMAPREGLVVEFGVATGQTLRRIASRRQPVHGFDSFAGLPERWRSGFDRAAFAQSAPTVDGAQLHIGLFEEALPNFLESHAGPIAFAHFDADLYSSTATVFQQAEERFVTGSVLLFDEYFNYPGWEQHEHRAFIEFAERTEYDYAYRAYNSMHQQVLVQLTGVGGG